MWNQTFTPADVPRLFVLIFLECALSADNAVAIASLVAPLPERLQKKALWIGSFSSLILRLAAIVSAVFLVQHAWVQLVGAAYLIYLAFHGMVKEKKERKVKSETPSFFWTVVKVELTDLIFAVDSILAALAFTGTFYHDHHLPPKIWLVYAAGIFGVIAMRFAAGYLTGLMQRWPLFKLAAHLMIGWIGIKMIYVGIQAYYTFTIPYFNLVFWLGILVFLAIATFRRYTPKP